MIDDNYYHGCRTDEFIESFKKFHNDIDLILYRQPALNKIFQENPGITFLNAKSTFAKYLYDDYDLCVNMDTDHLIFSRLNEVLEGDYDVCSPSVLNEFCNISLDIARTGLNNVNIVSINEYLDPGMIAGNKNFWQIMLHNDINHSLKFHSKDMDAFNLMLRFYPFKIKIPQGHSEPTNPLHKCWYGCSSMGREKRVKINNNQIILDNKPLKNYHFGKFILPKTHPNKLFSKDVCEWIYSEIVKGKIPEPKSIRDGVFIY
jgi:hypothetical protein